MGVSYDAIEFLQVHLLLLIKDYADITFFNEIAHSNLNVFQAIMKNQLEKADNRIGNSSAPLPGEFSR